MHFKLIPLLGLLIFTAEPVSAQELDSRVASLLNRMTLEEKVGQLVMTGFDEALGTDLLQRGGAGSVISFNDAAAIARAQERARASRLGIPLLVGLDLLHGFRTLFPLPLAEAASFDPELAARNAELAAREAAAAGINWTFAPMADIGRDPRWGRAIEGSGEDVLLATDFTAARVRGFHAGGLAATLKHFAAYGAVAGGRDYDAVSVSDDELYNVHLPPFAAAAQPRTAVMTALTVLNGKPASASPLIADLLRGDLNFAGVVVSDWKAILGLVDQGFAQDEADAARKALKAGIDIDMMSGLYAKHLAEEAKAGRVAMSEIDAAVHRVLKLKFELGLFDAPPTNPAEIETTALSAEMRGAARATVRDTVVLLRNEADVLPLRPETKNIAVIGPFADNAFDQLGPHEARGRPEDAVTILKGIEQRAQKNGANIRYAQGCDAFCNDDKGFAEAVEAALASDLVIAVLGERREFAGEGASRAFLDFWGQQDELLEVLAATGKPVVLIIVGGRPLDLRRASQIAPGILMAWYPGTEGGNGVADILFGDHAPSAKLPISWPRSIGQAPIHYDRLATGRPHDPNARYTMRFLDEDATPLYPFGHGLAYTRFTYSNLKVTPEKMTLNDDVFEVSVDLVNIGERDGTEIVQVYVRDEAASRVLPQRKLRAYRRVSLKAGEKTRVSFELSRENLSFEDDIGAMTIENGNFRIGVGGNSGVELSKALILAD